MEQKHLIDTNILIYAFANEPPEPLRAWLASSLRESFRISIVTRIEFLGWTGHTDEGHEKAVSFLQEARIYPLDQPVADRAIELRRRIKIKLPDAVIAATCLVHDLALVTRNSQDFTDIEGLRLVNPFTQQEPR